MRVRATDPRPCPKCGKIYRSAHTLRTHLEDKHTICPGYRCVLCGTVAKSRNSLHSHMSRQHRGISTKDLPVLPMPSPFDPELASRLLAKAGIKVSFFSFLLNLPQTGGGNSDLNSFFLLLFLEGIKPWAVSLRQKEVSLSGPIFVFQFKNSWTKCWWLLNMTLHFVSFV